MQAAIQSTSAPTLQKTGGRNRLARRIQILIVFLPVLFTFLYVRALSVEVPIQDDWDLFVPSFEHLAAGHLQWSDINSQHNEHVVVFPVAIALFAAKVSGGRLLAVTYLSYAFLCGSLGILFLFFRMIPLRGRWSTLRFLPVSLLFLGWRQSDSLLWSTHLANTVTLFFALASLYCCARVRLAPVLFPAAILCAWVACFSTASGLLVWPCGVLALLGSGTRKQRFEERLRFLVGWLVLAAACAGCFFLDSAPHPVPWPTGIRYVAANPLAAVKYAVTYLGGPLGGTSHQALLLGGLLALLSLPALVLSIWSVRKLGIGPGLILASFVGLAMVPLLSGRLGLGIEQAFASRYVTSSSLAPIGVYFCCLSLAGVLKGAGRFLNAAMLLLLLYGVFNSYTSGIADGRKESAALTQCANAVKDFRQVDRRRLLCAHIDPGVVLQRAPLLEQYHLSLFEQ